MRGQHLTENIKSRHGGILNDTQFTFRDFEFVVLLVPQAASVAVGYPGWELSVWTVRGLQGKVGG